MPRKRKVVIIGTEGFKMSTNKVRVDCFTWDKIKRIVNLRDYDTVIVDLLGISDESAREKINWDDVDDVLNVFSALSILQHRGEFIIIGDPRFSIPKVTAIDKEGNPIRKQKPFLLWTGMKFYWDKAPGDTIHFNNDYKHRLFEEYVGKLSKWNYSLHRVEIDSEEFGKTFNMEFFAQENISPKIDTDFFCRNRYDNGLAFILRLLIMKTRSTYSGEKTEPFLGYGPIIFLPKIDASEEETLTIVLRDACGVEASLPEPEWISDYEAPGQAVVDQEIAKIVEELGSARDRFLQAQKKRGEIRTCLKLLYEREFGLEPAVRDVLRGLGAHVEDPKEPNKEDGWITVNVGDQVYEGVLEIKSTRSAQFGEDGIKQLLSWIGRGIKLRKKKYKGIFIGNSSVDHPVKERSWPFSDDWSKSAELHEMCAMTTTNIYVIHLLKYAGKLDLDSFWKEVFETNGIFDNKIRSM